MSPVAHQKQVGVRMNYVGQKKHYSFCLLKKIEIISIPFLVTQHSSPTWKSRYCGQPYQILERNDKFEIGLELLKSEESRLGLFNNGVTVAVFRQPGTTAVIRLVLKIVKRSCPTVLKICFGNLDGMIS